MIERGPAGNGRRQSLGRNQVFAAIRTPQYLYAQYEDGEQELYDLARDPYELQSLHADLAYSQLRATLAARLAALRNCAGAACWQH